MQRTQEQINKLGIHILLIVFAYALYSPSLFYDYFIFDDAFHIKNNVFVNNSSLFSLFVEWPNSLQPLPYKVWQWVNFFFGKESATPFRILNILFHGINGALLYQFLKTFLNGLGFWKEGETPHIFITLIAALFIAHPVQVESIVWVSSFRGTLAAFWTLLALNQGLKSTFGNNDSFRVSYFFMTLFLALAILSKMTSALVPLIILLIDLIFKKDKTLIYFLSKYTFITIILISVLLLFSNQIFQVIQITTFTSDNWIFLSTIFDKFRRMLLPTEYLFQRLPSKSAFQFSDLDINTINFLLFYALLITTLSLLATFRAFRPTFFFLLGTIIFSFATSGVVHFNFQNISIVADRYLYLPSLFFIPSLILLSYKLLQRSKQALYVLTLTCFIILGWEVYKTSNIISTWKKNSTVLESSIAKNTTNKAILIPYAKALLDERKRKEAFDLLKDFYYNEFGSSRETILDNEYISLGLDIISSGIHYHQKVMFVENYFNGGNISFKRNDLKKLSTVMLNYGDIYKGMSFGELALELDKSAGDSEESLEDYRNIIMNTRNMRLYHSYLTIAHEYRRNEKFEDALNIAKQARKILNSRRTRYLINEIESEINRKAD